MTPRPHRHEYMDPEMKAAVDRPPDIVRIRKVIEVEFRRGEGCCEQDIVRRCTAFYDLDGNLLGVVDPVREIGQP